MLWKKVLRMLPYDFLIDVALSCHKHLMHGEALSKALHSLGIRPSTLSMGVIG
jgi:hypothetical protein